MTKSAKIVIVLVLCSVHLFAQRTDGSVKLQFLDSIIQQSEDVLKVIPETKAKVIWSSSYKHKKSPLAFVYLHGFGASHREGEPIMTMLSKHFDANVFMSRLEAHGIQDASGYESLTPKKYLKSAKEALEIGKKLGEKVILVSTSTGGMLSLKLASEDKDIKALVLYSPFIDVIDPKTMQLLNPKGKVTFIKQYGGETFVQKRPAEQIPYWSTHYHVNGYVALLQLLKDTMKKETFQKVTCPVFLGYYYKNEQHQDQVVSVKAMQKMYQLLGTDSKHKIEIAFPKSGNHVIGCDLRSKDWESVYEATTIFIENNLQQK